MRLVQPSQETQRTTQKGPPDASFWCSRASTNTIVEIEYGRLLPPTLQVHVARIPLLTRGSSDTDVDYQARLLGSAKVEVVALMQTGATLSADDYDEKSLAA